MAVAKGQMSGLRAVFEKHLPSKEIRIQLLRDMRLTEAYRNNRSFAITIDRLLEAETKES